MKLWLHHHKWQWCVIFTFGIFRPIATDVTCHTVCLSVWYTGGHVKEDGWTNQDAVWEADSREFKKHALDGVEIPPREWVISGSCPATYQVFAAVYAAKWAIQFSITARHAMRSFVKIRRPFVSLLNVFETETRRHSRARDMLPIENANI